MASIADLFRDIDAAAGAADSSVAGAAESVREFGRASSEAADRLAAAAPPATRAPRDSFRALGPGREVSGGSGSGGSGGSASGGFERVGESPSGGTIGGGSGGGSGSGSGGGSFQRVEAAVTSGLSRLVTVSTNNQRATIAVLGQNAAAINRLAAAFERDDGGAGFRARFGRGL